MSWTDLIITPATVVTQDLEMVEMENSMVNYKQSGSQSDLDKIKKANANFKR